MSNLKPLPGVIVPLTIVTLLLVMLFSGLNAEENTDIIQDVVNPMGSGIPWWEKPFVWVGIVGMLACLWYFFRLFRAPRSELQGLAASGALGRYALVPLFIAGGIVAGSLYYLSW